MSFGFSAEASAVPGGMGPGGAPNKDPTRRESSHIPSVNVAPTGGHDMTSDTPEIRKYKKRFNSEILCAALWGVNLLIGTGKFFEISRTMLQKLSKCEVKA